jgi:hypothetical protein
MTTTLQPGEPCASQVSNALMGAVITHLGGAAEVVSPRALEEVSSAVAAAITLVHLREDQVFHILHVLNVGPDDPDEAIRVIHDIIRCGPLEDLHTRFPIHP